MAVEDLPPKAQFLAAIDAWENDAVDALNDSPDDPVQLDKAIDTINSRLASDLHQLRSLTKLTNPGIARKIRPMSQAIEVLDQRPRARTREGIESAAMAMRRAVETLYGREDLLGSMVKTHFKHGKFNVINEFGLPEAEFQGALDTLDEAAKKIDEAGFGSLLYGTIKMTYLKCASGSYYSDRDFIEIGVHCKFRFDAVYTLIHEFGHRLWFKFMNDEERKEFISAYRTCSKASATKYGSTSAVEDFAELFAHHVLGKPIASACAWRLRKAAKLPVEKEHEVGMSAVKLRRRADRFSPPIMEWRIKQITDLKGWRDDPKIAQAYNDLRKRRWENRDDPSIPVSVSELVLVAYGRNGEQLAKSLKSRFVRRGDFTYDQFIKVDDTQASKRKALSGAETMADGLNKARQPFRELCRAAAYGQCDKIADLLRDHEYTEIELLSAKDIFNGPCTALDDALGDIGRAASETKPKRRSVIVR